MKMNLNTARSLGILLILMAATAGFIFPQHASANANIVDIEGVGYDVNASIGNNLNSLTGKKVYLTLASGKNISGTLKAVGKKLIHLEKLDGKDFFDALIKIDDISAIDTRFREYKKK